MHINVYVLQASLSPSYMQSRRHHVQRISMISSLMLLKTWMILSSIDLVRVLASVVLCLFLFVSGVVGVLGRFSHGSSFVLGVLFRGRSSSPFSLFIVVGLFSVLFFVLVLLLFVLSRGLLGIVLVVVVFLCLMFCLGLGVLGFRLVFLGCRFPLLL